MCGVTDRAPSRADAAQRLDEVLLRAAREVVAVEGSRASVAAIAARAGVGIGSLYRRWASKDELFQHLVAVAIKGWLDAARAGLAEADPWTGLNRYVAFGLEGGAGSLGALAGSISLTSEMAEQAREADALAARLLARAQAAGAVRADVTLADVNLLIEQLARSPLLEQLERQGRDDLRAPAAAARRRVLALALGGLRTHAGSELPGDPPAPELLSERWAPAPSPPPSG
jgi:AcrR family transcriptional regulator